MNKKQKFEMLTHIKRVYEFELEEIYENKKVTSMIFKEKDQDNFITVYEEKTPQGLEVKIIFVGEEEPHHTEIKKELEIIYNLYLDKNLYKCTY